MGALVPTALAAGKGAVKGDFVVAGGTEVGGFVVLNTAEGGELIVNVVLKDGEGDVTYDVVVFVEGDIDTDGNSRPTRRGKAPPTCN